jgi:hypothetical protein
MAGKCLNKRLLFQPIKMAQCAMSYQESGIKWSDVAENIIIIDWQCKIILYCKYIFLFFTLNSCL